MLPELLARTFRKLRIGHGRVAQREVDTEGGVPPRPPVAPTTPVTEPTLFAGASSANTNPAIRFAASAWVSP